MNTVGIAKEESEIIIYYYLPLTHRNLLNDNLWRWDDMADIYIFQPPVALIILPDTIEEPSDIIRTKVSMKSVHSHIRPIGC